MYREVDEATTIETIIRTDKTLLALWRPILLHRVSRPHPQLHRLRRAGVPGSNWCNLSLSRNRSQSRSQSPTTATTTWARRNWSFTTKSTPRRRTQPISSLKFSSNTSTRWNRLNSPTISSSPKKTHPTNFFKTPNLKIHFKISHRLTFYSHGKRMLKISKNSFLPKVSFKLLSKLKVKINQNL